MKKVNFFIILIILIIPSSSYALIHTYKGLTGGADANLDGIETANISNGEIATGADSSNTWRWYYYNASNNNTTNPESSPDVIVPDDNSSGTGAWILVSTVDQGASATPNITFEDSDSPGEANIYCNSTGDCVIKINADDSVGDNTSYLIIDGTDEVIKVNKPMGITQRTVEVDPSGGEVTLTTQVGSNNYDWWGVSFVVTADDNDVIIPECSTTTSPNKYDAQIEVCQSAASDTVSLVSADSNNDFILRDGTTLTAGYELDSPGASQRYMCVTLKCAPTSNGFWVVMNETGGTASISPTWVSGGAPD